jgi:hypothetical protein
LPAFASKREALAERLRAIVPGERSVLTDEADLIAYGYDAAWFDGDALVVVRPQTLKKLPRFTASRLQNIFR